VLSSNKVKTVAPFGDKLRQLRMQQGLTQRALAHALGYTNAHAYISDFETGKRRPTAEFVLKVARYFNVSADLLLKDELDLDDAGMPLEDNNAS
jgi:transcriptional regulator with XRE-family HTH domain